MKNTKICPKCQSRDIVMIEGHSEPYGGKNNKAITGKAIFSVLKMHRYICCACGFTEAWIAEEDLPKAANVRYSQK